MRKTNTVIFTKYQANFLSKAFNQTKAGPRSSGTHFPVLIIIIKTCPSELNERLISMNCKCVVLN